MATLTVSDISGILSKVVPQRFADATVQRKNMFSLIRRRPMSDALGPVWRAKSSAAGSAAAFASGGTYPAAGFEGETEVRAQSWGRYAATMTIEEQALLQLLANPNQTFVANRLGSMIQGHIDELVTVINGHLIANDPEGAGNANGVYGLDAICDTGNTIAGLARGSNSWLQAAHETAVGGALATSHMRAMIQAARTNNSGALQEPAILTTHTVANIVGALDDGKATNFNAVNGGMNAKIQGNYDVTQEYPVACYYNGIPVIPIDGMTSGALYLIDLSHLWIEFLSGQIPEGSEATQIVSDGIMVKPLTQVQGSPVYAAHIVVYLQSWFENTLKWAGKLTGITS